MNSKLFIPEKVKAGYQERKDTFTKKLAYVIYYDEKGVLRKEKSWQSWRDDKIEPLDFENKPYSGFTLNKGILRDGYWGGGHNMVRIYDDRGVEFEITVSNLMYILMGNDCNKRVLSGEFVYAWNGTELVLLPTNTEEYKVSTTFTSLKTNKVSMKELQANVGCVFKTKGLEDWVYLGKIEWNDKTCVYGKHSDGRKNYSDWKYVSTRDKRHIFYNLKTERYFNESSPTKLAYLIDPNKVHDFEDLLEGYFTSNNYTLIEEIVMEVKEDITDKFITGNQYEKISKDDWIYFIDNKGNHYHASNPRYVQKAQGINGHISNRGYKTLYYEEMPKKEGWYMSNENHYNRVVAERCNPTYNEGYTEWNIRNGGIRFNRVEVILKAMDGRVIPLKGNEISSYYFTDNLKITTNK